MQISIRAMQVAPIFVILISNVSHATFELRTVALSGDPVPESQSGGVFDFFVPPAINDLGETAFRGFITGRNISQFQQDEGVFSEASGTGLKTIALRGDLAAEVGPGVTFGEVNSVAGQAAFGSVGIGNSGQTVFSTSLAGPGLFFANNQAIFSQVAGNNLSSIAIENSSAPGNEPGVNFFSYESPVFNSRGETAFVSGLTAPFSNGGRQNVAVFSNAGVNGLMQVSSESDVVPGAAAGVGFHRFANPMLNDNGEIALHVNLDGGAEINALNRGAIAVGTANDGLRVVLRNGDRAPNTESGVTVTSLGVPDNLLSFPDAGFPPVDLNNNGQVAFRASLVGGRAGPTSFSRDYAIYTGKDSEGLRLVARTGDTAPGFRRPFDTIHNPVINDSGHAAFAAKTQVGDTMSDDAIFSEGGGDGLRLVAREGDLAPGTSLTFGDFSLAQPVLNDRGQLAFMAILSNFSELGIFAQNSMGELQLIARTGGQIDVSDDPLVTDLRTISGLRSGQGLFFSGAFNNRGQLAFTANFTDGTSGIFVSDLVAVPEPRSLLLIVFSLLFTCRYHPTRGI